MKCLTFFATLVILSGSFSANADEICGKPIRIQANPRADEFSVTLENGEIVSRVHVGGMSSYGVFATLTSAIASSLNICLSPSLGYYWITSVSK